MSVSWYWTPPSPKPYILTFPHCHFGAVSQSWDAASWTTVLILPQIKLNSQLSSYTSYLVNISMGLVVSGMWTCNSVTKPRQHIKKQIHHFADKGPPSQSYGFSSSHVCMLELDQKEGWALKNWCLQIAVLEKILESPLDCKEIKPVNPKGNQPWIFTGRTEAKAPRLWPPDTKSQLTGKDWF